MRLPPEPTAGGREREDRKGSGSLQSPTLGIGWVGGTLSLRGGRRGVGRAGERGCSGVRAPGPAAHGLAKFCLLDSACAWCGSESWLGGGIAARAASGLWDRPFELLLRAAEQLAGVAASTAGMPHVLAAAGQGGGGCGGRETVTDRQGRGSLHSSESSLSAVCLPPSHPPTQGGWDSLPPGSQGRGAVVRTAVQAPAQAVS